MYAGAPGATCDYQHGETVNMIAEVHLSKIIGSLIPQTLHFFGGTIYRMFLSCVSRHTMLGSMSSEGGSLAMCNWHRLFLCDSVHHIISYQFH